MLNKIYTVIDDCAIVLVTADRIKAALKLMELTEKYDGKQSYFWFDEGELK